jgi:hypothetical protein
MPISTFNGLNIALSAVQAEQRSLDTTSHNIANASTAGYSRQVSELVARPGLGIAERCELRLGLDLLVERLDEQRREVRRVFARGVHFASFICE